MSKLEKIITQLYHFKDSLFTGSLSIKASESLSWVFYFRMGRLIWATGGLYPEERWRRHLISYCSEITNEDLKQMLVARNLHGEYGIVSQLLKEKKLTTQQSLELIKKAIVEVLFDVIQYGVTCENDLLYYDNPNDIPNTPLTLIETEQACKLAIKAWHEWQATGLAKISPNSFAIIKQPKLLLEKASSNLYEAIAQEIDGTQTLRSLALKTKQDILTLSKSLTELADSGALSFSLTPIQNRKNLSSNSSNSHSQDTFKPLVGCVDDSMVICHALEIFITQRGYRFIGVQDPMKAISVFASAKPDLIFVDLVMPHLDGYELCTQIRKTPEFKELPIVILTGKDGLVDRMRAKLVGANNFLSKPPQPEQIFEILDKYLLIKQHYAAIARASS
jgi:two-component system, chemotaxis family, response regulator PixG